MDNTRIKIEDLSAEAKQELDSLVKNQENAFEQI